MKIIKFVKVSFAFLMMLGGESPAEGIIAVNPASALGNQAENHTGTNFKSTDAEVISTTISLMFDASSITVKESAPEKSDDTKASKNEAKSVSPNYSNRHVIIFGIDGVRPDALQAANATHLMKLAAGGTATYDAYSGGVLGTSSEQGTSSGPSWASILTGVWTDKHKVIDNGFSGFKSDDYPVFFKRVREYNPEASLSSISHWSPIDTHLMESVSEHLSIRKTASSTECVVKKAVAHLASASPQVLFLHFDEVDGAGHAHGYGATNADYLSAIRSVDSGIGKILEAVRSRPNYANESWIYVATTDHGGIGTNHGGQTEDERKVWVIVNGGGAPIQVISPGPGIVCIPATVMAALGMPIKKEWGLEAAPFGVPPVEK